MFDDTPTLPLFGLLLLAAAACSGAVTGLLYSLNLCWQANPWATGLSLGAGALVASGRFAYLRLNDPYGRHALGLF